ncbi:hypothetical protein H9P43_000573 [Blastocladiella emersonii ATCC 22665]|nr:hypothetical protein H9P43_000573 [Blastocladiella emersonii ATCC 22665]
MGTTTEPATAQATAAVLFGPSEPQSPRKLPLSNLTHAVNRGIVSWYREAIADLEWPLLDVRRHPATAPTAIKDLAAVLAKIPHYDSLPDDDWSNLLSFVITRLNRVPGITKSIKREPGIVVSLCAAAERQRVSARALHVLHGFFVAAGFPTAAAVNLFTANARNPETARKSRGLWISPSPDALANHRLAATAAATLGMPSHVDWIVQDALRRGLLAHPWGDADLNLALVQVAGATRGPAAAAALVGAMARELYSETNRTTELGDALDGGHFAVPASLYVAAGDASGVYAYVKSMLDMGVTFPARTMYGAARLLLDAGRVGAARPLLEACHGTVPQSPLVVDALLDAHVVVDREDGVRELHRWVRGMRVKGLMSERYYALLVAYFAKRAAKNKDTLLLDQALGFYQEMVAAGYTLREPVKARIADIARELEYPGFEETLAALDKTERFRWPAPVSELEA